MIFSGGYSSLSQWFLRECQTLLHTKQSDQPATSISGKLAGTWPSTASLSVQRFAAECFHNNFNTTKGVIRINTSICSISMQSLNSCIKSTITHPCLRAEHTECFQETHLAQAINSAWGRPTVTSGDLSHPSRQHLLACGESSSLSTTGKAHFGPPFMNFKNYITS